MIELILVKKWLWKSNFYVIYYALFAYDMIVAIFQKCGHASNYTFFLIGLDLQANVQDVLTTWIAQVGNFETSTILRTILNKPCSWKKNNPLTNNK